MLLSDHRLKLPAPIEAGGCKPRRIFLKAHTDTGALELLSTAQ